MWSFKFSQNTYSYVTARKGTTHTHLTHKSASTRALKITFQRQTERDDKALTIQVPTAQHQYLLLISLLSWHRKTYNFTTIDCPLLLSLFIFLYRLWAPGLEIMTCCYSSSLWAADRDRWQGISISVWVISCVISCSWVIALRSQGSFRAKSKRGEPRRKRGIEWITPPCWLSQFSLVGRNNMH